MPRRPASRPTVPRAPSLGERLSREGFKIGERIVILTAGGTVLQGRLLAVVGDRAVRILTMAGGEVPANLILLVKRRQIAAMGRPVRSPAAGQAQPESGSPAEEAPTVAPQVPQALPIAQAPPPPAPSIPAPPRSPAPPSPVAGVSSFRQVELPVARVMKT